MKVGRMISQRLRQHVLLGRIILVLLATRLGTFVLGLLGGGLPNLSPRYPFLLKCSEMSLEKRQQLVLSWRTSWFYLVRMIFFGMKRLISVVYFTQVDDNEDYNPIWEAIGYCGPDPYFISKKASESNKQSAYLTPKSLHNQPKEDLCGPLYKGIINVKCTQEILIESLKHSNFQVSINRKKKDCQMQVITIKCDVVVVGSGSGGGVAAGVLASLGYKVLVIDKGDYYARTNLSLLEGPTLDQMYEGAGLLSTKDLGVNILAGSTVGGGSTINWSASIRTPPHVIKEWADVHELEIFDSPLYKEALDVVCEKMEVQSDIDVSDEGFNNAVLRKGCLELGYPVVNIPQNAPKNHNCGWCCLGCKDGKKKSTCETWLKDVVNSGNGAILTGCEVAKVLYGRQKGRNRDTAKGVMFDITSSNDRQSSCVIVEAKATIIACGALNTPALLRRSGLNNKNIGKNLHLHPVVMAWGYFPDSEPLSSLLSDNQGDQVWPEKQKKSYEGGIMTTMSTVVADFNDSGYGTVIQTPSLHPGLFSAMMPWTSGLNIKHRMTKFSRTSHMFALARDMGSGVISTSPFDIKYKMHPIDEANLQKGIEKMLRILAAAGAEEIGTHHYSGSSINVKKASFHEFEKFVKKESSKAIQGLSMPIASAHQMGSCRMGINPRTSVVNQRGESWEVEGLYLADSSVFPTALGVNPMVTVQAISYCTTQSVLEFLRRRKTC
ncbi:long-chain-alcohol oxidase FAO4A isoform X2 [Beta vulgaris subsp. vulgaris]|uniref:long-chain-alcohol oxidase FAO4A isoform X2 n=1 Tax=Beta vulgaris subsp. vulgaris TaxID=3555 RepID=UPI0025481AAD|nr:long-chain-alcohol oxidase FAO4A isoform X2 [Beta vulgaris subsp. vulgaris]XP_057250908.1 long-chain-alcohol oxidase FAO4A isoform X2 [Beta vulgaris subsp. vulgaris]